MRCWDAVRAPTSGKGCERQFRNPLGELLRRYHPGVRYALGRLGPRCHRLLRRVRGLTRSLFGLVRHLDSSCLLMGLFGPQSHRSRAAVQSVPQRSQFRLASVAREPDSRDGGRSSAGGFATVKAAGYEADDFLAAAVAADTHRVRAGQLHRSDRDQLAVAALGGFATICFRVVEYRTDIRRLPHLNRVTDRLTHRFYGPVLFP